jgi:hypothetical protein
MGDKRVTTGANAISCLPDTSATFEAGKKARIIGENLGGLAQRQSRGLLIPCLDPDGEPQRSTERIERAAPTAFVPASELPASVDCERLRRAIR